MGRGFFFSPLKQPFFPSRPKPWDLPLPSYGLLPLSLAFHIFSFLPTRISSAGHQHSFPTGSLCLDIPAPPSVLCSFRRPTAKKKKKNQMLRLFSFTPPSNKNLLIHHLNTKFQICIHFCYFFVKPNHMLWVGVSGKILSATCLRPKSYLLSGSPVQFSLQVGGCPRADLNLESLLLGQLHVVRFCTGVR